MPERNSINRLFPERLTNDYRGHSLALWAFAAMTLLTITRSLAHIFLPDGDAQSIAIIPLDALPADAVAVMVGPFAQWGLSQLLGLLYALVLWRYRAFVRLMWLFILVE